MASQRSKPVVICIVPPGSSRPAQCVADLLDRAEIVTAQTLYEAAALLTTHRQDAWGLLLNSDSVIKKKHLDAIRLFQKYGKSVGMMAVSSPNGEVAGVDAKRYGMIGWNEVLASLAAVSPPEAAEPHRDEDFSHRGMTYNVEDIHADTFERNSVTDEMGVSYDGTNSQPLLTDQEMRALLGTPD